MGDLIKIVGVQYAVNSNHVKGEEQRAIFLLKQKLILLQLCPSCIKTIGKNGSRPCLYFL